VTKTKLDHPLHGSVNCEPDEVRALVEDLRAAEAEALLLDWNWWGRTNQRAPEEADWASRLILAVRRSGPSRIGAEMVRHWVQDFSLLNPSGATPAEGRDTMIEGESGILALGSRQEGPL
jgi:phage terminase large subunit-like protein